MREERPVADSTHVVETMYRPLDGERATPAAVDGGVSGDGGVGDDPSEGDADRLVVEGRVLGPDDDLVVRFVDVHHLRDGRIQRLRTYAR